MLPFEKAYEIALGAVRPPAVERIDIKYALNRILAEDVRSDVDMPPFDKSAMDGFACRRADLNRTLTLIETIPAGYVPRKTVRAGQCSKIMTGAVLPRGADCVIMKEHVEIPAEGVIRFVGEKTADNVCRRAEDVRKGDVVLRKGVKLKPQHIAVLASVGNTRPMAAVRPKVAVIATGNELIKPELKPNPAQIRNSNSFQMIAQIEGMGVTATDYGVVADTAGQIDRAFKKAAAKNDVIIVSGGVSVGDFDFVPGIFKRNSFELLFEKIAIKPGKPTVFGVSEKAYCFGLPGNPVAAFVLFEILVKPFMYKLMGHNYKAVNARLPLEESLINKEPKRQRWFPSAITDKGMVSPVEYHGSAHISSLCDADGLVCLDVGVTEVKKGTVVAVRLI